jgi:hypothetical protein
MKIEMHQQFFIKLSNTLFYENSSSGFQVQTHELMDRQIWSALNVLISCTSFKYMITIPKLQTVIMKYLLWNPDKTFTAESYSKTVQSSSHIHSLLLYDQLKQ